MYDQHKKNGDNQAQEPGWVGRNFFLLETKAFKKKSSAYRYLKSKNLKRFKQIELPAKLLDHFLCCNKSKSIHLAHHAFDVALSRPHFSARWLPFASFLIHLFSCFAVCLLAAVWEDVFSADFKRALLFVSFAWPVPNHPIFRPEHLFWPMLLLGFW